MSTYSPSLRIELINTGDQAGTWGNTTNTNLGTLIESAIAGYTSVSITSANQALTALNGVADESRNQTIALTTTTTANFNVYAPPAEKTYVIYNTTAYTATIYNSTVLGNTTAAGAGVSIPAGKTMTVWSDGTNFALQNTHLIGTVVGNVTGNLTGNVTGNVTGNLTGDVTGNVSGNAGTVTNGVYTTGNQTIAGTKTFSSTISGSINGNAATVTNGVYTTGDQTIAGNKTFSNRIFASNGSATAPSISFSSEGAVDTGLFWKQDGYMHVASNGQELGYFYPGGLELGGYSVFGGNLFAQNQSWQDVLGSRTFNVTYTNTTAKPILVSVVIQTNNTSSVLIVNGVAVGRTDGPSNFYINQIIALVPQGGTYYVSQGGNVPNILIWAEWR